MIVKWDRTGLQITIDFGSQIATRILKTELQSVMGLQSATSLDYKFRRDYKVIQYIVQSFSVKNGILKNFTKFTGKSLF